MEIISKLRNLQELTSQIIDDMDISFDIRTDVRFKQGKVVGLEEGKEIGLEEGKEIGLEKGITIGSTIKSMIAIRKILLAKIDYATICDFLDVTLKFVKAVEKDLKKEKEINQALSIKRARINTIAKKLEVAPLLVRALKQVLKPP